MAAKLIATTTLCFFRIATQNVFSHTVGLKSPETLTCCSLRGCTLWSEGLFPTRSAGCCSTPSPAGSHGRTSETSRRYMLPGVNSGARRRRRGGGGGEACPLQCRRWGYGNIWLLQFSTPTIVYPKTDSTYMVGNGPACWRLWTTYFALFARTIQRRASATS